MFGSFTFDFDEYTFFKKTNPRTQNVKILQIQLNKQLKNIESLNDCYYHFIIILGENIKIFYSEFCFFYFFIIKLFKYSNKYTILLLTYT